MADGQGRPLDGIVVADFSRVLAGPYATSCWQIWALT